jgi:hypothetical protein
MTSDEYDVGRVDGILPLTPYRRFQYDEEPKAARNSHMTRILILPAIVALAGLGACASGTSNDTTGIPAPSSASTTSSAPSSRVCDDDPAQAAIGKKVNDALLDDYRRISGAEIARALRPRSVMTMEYNPQRLNLRVDDNDIVTSVNCG